MMLALVQNETPDDAHRIVQFWKDAGIETWFNGTPEFDARFRAAFLELYLRAARGELDEWTMTPRGSLALILLLDQFPRNAFRGTPKMYDTDAHARRIAVIATAWGQDLLVERELRLFMYLPFGHSENLRDHERVMELVAHLGPEFVKRAEHHSDVVRRFGRYPHRNTILGRDSTSDEEVFLRNGGFSG